MPADLRLLETEDLRADESLLTGESIPGGKDADASVDEEASVGERRTMLHAGTEVPDGRALRLVCRTGQATEVDILAMYLPGLSDVLKVAPVPLWEWGALLGIAISLLLVIELFKLLRRWRQGSGLSNAQAAGT